MISLLPVLWPELLLIVTACGLFLLGLSRKREARVLAAGLALAALVSVFVVSISTEINGPMHDTMGGQGASPTLYVFHFAHYVKVITAGVGILLVLLAWPTGANATGNAALEFGYDAGEFFALMLLSIAGVFLVAGANDIILLFLGIELASIPTYIMVSISRPMPAAQEAGVKYFFLGAMAAALMLFGFSYLYGTTGKIHLDQISQMISHTPGGLTQWQLLAAVILLLGFGFKILAVPMHAYAGDVYQGAATPVTALLAFIPKTSGMAAIIKILFAVSGGMWETPHLLMKLLWVLAVLTMTFGNVLALLQFNIKRILAYSSVAHSGYMLVGLTTLLAASGRPDIQEVALAGVLFYLAAYGIMNVGAFGVLIALPARPSPYRGGRGAPANAPTSGAAETLDDLAGQGQRHIALGLAMAVCCFSLTGIPLTIGFLGKYFLIQPAWAMAHAANRSALSSEMGWLVVITMVNAAISAAYYLRIVATMFLRPAESPGELQRAPIPSAPVPFPIGLAVALSVIATLAFGLFFPAANALSDHARLATQIQEQGQMAQASAR